MMQNVMMGYGGAVHHEEITTIFVVGFPPDMQEREFQNMFIFSPGFEAATLKIPSRDEEEHTGHKKQIIGFAKFRTRLQALEARDILSGRKVDAEKGCVLKAEMAKKNLHTKRGLSNEFFHPAFQQYNMVNMGMALPMPPQVPYPTAAGQQQQQQQPSTGANGMPMAVPMRFRADSASYNAAAVNMPHSVQDAAAGLGLAGVMGANGGAGMGAIPTPTSATASGGTPGMPEYTKLEYLNSSLKDSKQSAPPSLQNLFGDSADSVVSSPTSTSNVMGGLAAAASSSYGSLPSANGSSASLASSSASLPTNSRTYSGGDYFTNVEQQHQQQSNKKLSVNINLANSLASKSLQSAVLPSPTTPMINFDAPAFQYKPANTLYIGQLPNTVSDQDLRTHMSFCEGFKRILYSGSSGVYIEFASEEYAQAACTELRNKYALTDIGTLSTASDAKMSQINASFNLLRSATL
ncbi:hypothetical protein RI367_001120 [Sorochytrium milnesiophthora]